MEPYRLRKWRRKGTDGPFLYTCARPGRSYGPKGSISDSMVRQWVEHLPGFPNVTIISLLGRKPNGMSEYDFYSFCGEWENAIDKSNAFTFRKWLEERYPLVELIEHPTEDFKRIPKHLLQSISADVKKLLELGKTVVLVDSGGETRTRQVCNDLGLVEDTRK